MLFATLPPARTGELQNQLTRSVAANTDPVKGRKLHSRGLPFMMMVASIGFWSVVAYLAFRPQTTRLVEHGPVAIQRSRREGVKVKVESAPQAARTMAALPSRRSAPAVAARPSQAALPGGAQPMRGAVGALPLPSRFE